MLKSLKLQPKLNELYMGPFTVHKQTKNKNYILINAKHELLRDSVPLSRIKVVPNEIDDTQYFNMETILKDRLKKGVRQYLVKWEGYDSSYNTWEPASVFVSPQVIEDYWERKSKIGKIHLTTPSLNFMSIITIILTILNYVTTGCCYTVNDAFRLCTHNKYSQKIDINAQCNTLNSIPQSTIKSSISILEKRYNLIEGIGYMCTKSKISISTHKTWKNEERSERSVTVEKLSRSDCLAMFISKNCQG